MDTINQSTTKEKSPKANFEKKWWQKLGQKMKAFFFAEATEQQRRNSLDYYQYWYRDIMEEDLQKQKISES